MFEYGVRHLSSISIIYISRANKVYFPVRRELTRLCYDKHKSERTESTCKRITGIVAGTYDEKHNVNLVNSGV